MPPLYLWIAVAALSIGIFGSLGSIEEQEPLHSLGDRYLHYKKRLDSFISSFDPARDSCVAILWGSSLSCQAVDHSYNFRRRFKEHSGQQIGFYKIFMLNANSHYFRGLKSLFEATGKISPDLLLIETQLMAIDVHYGHPLEAEFRNFHREVTEWWRKPEPKKIGNHPRFANFDQFNNRLHRAQELDTINLPDRRYLFRDFRDNRAFNKDLARFRDQQIPIVLLHLPRPSYFEDMVMGPNGMEHLEQLVADYREAGYDMQLWAYHDPLPFSHYSDYAHMNLQGMKKFSSWLQGQLEQHFEGQCMN